MRPLTLTQQQLAALAESVFERAGTIHFEARGSSMRPLIRSGDMLTLEPVDGHALHVGEVGLFRDPSGRLFVHRLVRKSVVGGKSVLFFRGDGRFGELETVAPSRVLARVTTVGRDGRTFLLAGDRARLAANLWRVIAPVGARALYLGEELRLRAARTARWLQGTETYRRLGRQALAGRVCYRLGTAEDTARWNRFHRLPGAGAASQVTREVDSAFWTMEHGFTQVAVLGGQLLGVADLVRLTERDGLDPEWWLFDMRIGPLYRGLGIGEGVVAESLQQLRRRGARRLSLRVFSDNRPALELYRKLGFTEASRARHEAPPECHRASPAQRTLVILTRRLTSALRVS